MADRWNTHVFWTFPETTAFATLEAGYSANKRSIPCWDVGINLKHQPLENQVVRSDLGEHPPGVGLAYPESDVSLTTYLQGVGGGGAPTTAPTLNAFSDLLAAALGAHGTAGAGSTVKAASSPTTTSVAETDGGNHAENSLVAFQMPDGTVEVRPVGDYTTDTMTLLMALSTAPDEGDIIYGGINFAMTEAAGSTLAKIQGRLVGKNSAQNYEYRGAVGHLTINEHSSAEAQTATWRIQAADFSRYVSEAQVTPGLILPTVTAGGEFLIGMDGSTVTHALDWMRVQIEPAREYAAHEAANEAIGIQDWVLVNATHRVTIHVLDTDEVPTAFDPTTYFGVFVSTDIAQKIFHVLFNFGGRRAGEIVSLCMLRLHMLMEPEAVEINGIAAQKIQFAATAGAGPNGITSKMLAAQF